MVSRRGAARLEGALWGSLLCSDSWGDGAVGANLITPWGGGKPYHRGSEGAQPKRPISLPKYQQYSLVYLGARVQMDLFLDDSQERKTVRLPPGSMQVRTMDSTPGAAALPLLASQDAAGNVARGHTAGPQNTSQETSSQPPEPTSPPGK